MSLDQFAYLFTTLIFAGGAVVIEWTLGTRRLKKYLKVIGITIGVMLVGTLIAEPVALKWEIWVYNPKKSFNLLFFGGEIETYIFTIFVSIAVASATLIWSDYEKRNLPLIKTTWKKLKQKIR